MTSSTSPLIQYCMPLPSPIHPLPIASKKTLALSASWQSHQFSKVDYLSMPIAVTRAPPSLNRFCRKTFCEPTSQSAPRQLLALLNKVQNLLPQLVLGFKHVLPNKRNKTPSKHIGKNLDFLGRKISTPCLRDKTRVCHGKSPSRVVTTGVMLVRTGAGPYKSAYNSPASGVAC